MNISQNNGNFRGIIRKNLNNTSINFDEMTNNFGKIKKDFFIKIYYNN